MLRPVKQRVRERPIRLGPAFLVTALVGGVVIVALVKVLEPSNADLTTLVSVAASAIATYFVLLLSSVTAVNWVVSATDESYIFLLPRARPRISHGWLVLATLIAGLIAGKIVWR